MRREQVPPARQPVDLSESSVWGNSEEGDAEDLDSASTDGDTATEATIDRLESIIRDADEPEIPEGELAEKFDELDASTDEEVDALEVNLLQDDELADARDGSGRIIDDLAEERIGKLTETGPFEDSQGTLSVSPGSDDTSSTLRRHQPKTGAARTDPIVEGNIDAPQDEIKSDSKVDEETGD